MNFEPIRAAVMAAILPIKPANAETSAAQDFLFKAQRTDAGRDLPPYYLVYFLLVDLLGFKNIGQFEKVAWSVPIDFEGRAFVIEHRKLGLGVFAAELPVDEEPAKRIVGLIHKAVKIAQPYFDWRAAEAVAESKLNVINRSTQLHDRFEFFMSSYEAKRSEAERRAQEKITTQVGSGFLTRFPAMQLNREAKWLALSAIESFFSWTEHVFILLSILTGKCVTGNHVANLAKADWSDKFKSALDIGDPETKRFYDELTLVRQQLRNFVAHGSFGKQGDAFQFHSGAGAAPVRLPRPQDKVSFRFGRGVEFVDHEAIVLIAKFIDFFWSGDRAPAKTYIQDNGLPLILTMAKDGEYARAMSSDEDMNEFVDHLGHLMDRHANMDF
jgi:hypothetical protein